MIERELTQKIVPWLFENKVLIIKGARQVGKTTLLYHISSLLTEKYSIANTNIFYFSLDAELGNPIFQDAKSFIRYIEIRASSLSFPFFVLLDEFQYINDAGLFLKIVHDFFQDKVHFIVTGSSSLEIAKTSEYLTGRKVEFTLNQFSFLEFLKADSKTDFLLNDKISIEDIVTIYKKELKNKLCEYIMFGGFPEVVLQKDIEKKKVILKDIIATYLQKDISSFFRIQKIEKFNMLTKILAFNISQLINKYELSNTIGLNLETLGHYLSILQGTYVFSLLKPFYSNKRKETIKMQKIYINDLGYYSYFQNYAMDFNYDLISGNIIENFVFNELSRLFQENIYFYRTISKAEIDFVIMLGKEPIPVEVKFRNKIKTIPEVIKNFRKNYKISKKTIIVTKNEFKENNEAIFIPPYAFPFFLRNWER